MLHALFDTPCGFILATTDDRGVLVLARPVPPSFRDNLDGLKDFVAEGGIYVIAMREKPGSLHALQVPAAWGGEAIDGDHVISRAAAAQEVGERLIEVCCTIAGELAGHAYVEWQTEERQKHAALRAVLTRLPVGEA